MDKPLETMNSAFQAMCESAEDKSSWLHHRLTSITNTGLPDAVRMDLRLKLESAWLGLYIELLKANSPRTSQKEQKEKTNG